jgi:predicted transcriptional regulator
VTDLTNRRSPDTIAYELLEAVAEKGEATKWDLIKILGNDTQFRLWVDRFLLPEKVLSERREGRNYYYRLTDRGELFYQVLKNGNVIRLFNRISGRRLKK